MVFIILKLNDDILLAYVAVSDQSDIILPVPATSASEIDCIPAARCGSAL